VAPLDLITMLLIAIGLAMDAFAVSIAKGMTVKKDRRKTAVMLAVFFGGFQALMPAIGWMAGLGLKDIIMGIDHWIAFGLLGFIGAKMIFESTKSEGDDGDKVTLTLALTLAVATSIDALMVGLSFALLETSILLPILIIGMVTFALSLIGFMGGSGLGRMFGKKIQIVGGIILIFIGLQILVEHLTA
jgi:manganese efflux pump family protein